MYSRAPLIKVFVILSSESLTHTHLIRDTFIGILEKPRLIYILNNMQPHIFNYNNSFADVWISVFE